MNHDKNNRIVDRPWGKFIVLDEQQNYKIKRIEVIPGGRLSYQFHNKRQETWLIIDGAGIIIIDSKELKYSKGDIFQIPVKSKHRIYNTGNKKTILIEIQTGKYFGEDDIVRLEDDYDRVK